MKNYRNRSFMVVCLFMYCFFLCVGCADKSALYTEDNRIHIVCTTFPQYDWIAELIRGNETAVSLTLLMDKGGDLHNFQPSALDIAHVSKCDLFIYVGGESDVWVDDLLKEAVNPKLCAINMMEVIQERLVEEEHVEDNEYMFGIKKIDNHSTQQIEHHHEQEYDEHVWLSLRNAELIVEEIAAKLTLIDSGNSDLYQRNCDRYTAALRALDLQFVKAVDSGKKDTLLFADRFPFRYFVEDYGLNYYAAFNGCSAETEASFGTVAFLIDKLDALQLDFVIVLDGSDDRLAQVVIENTGSGQQQVCVLNSMQSVSNKEIEAGLCYLNVMEENLKMIRKLLE